MRILLVLLLLPMAAQAAEVGQYFSPIGDTVTVRLARNGNYVARIETSKNGRYCTFEKQMQEVEEGDLRYATSTCSVQVLQDGQGSLSVNVIGCESFCDDGVNLRITRARKE